MAYQFNRKPISTFLFYNSESTVTDTTKFAGINATVQSADVICDGVSSLMAIGGNSAFFVGAKRASEETVSEEE